VEERTSYLPDKESGLMSVSNERGAALNPSNHADGKGDRYSGAPFATRSPVIAKNAMAATAQPLATLVAIDILKKGGSAMDAAIAANATLGLVEPMACGIGGDIFAIVWDPKSRSLHGYNGSGRSPKGQSLEQFKARLGGRTQIPQRGALTLSVPGAVEGWFTLQEKFGRLPMQDVLAPAISYAREGHPVSQYVAMHWQENMDAFAASKDIEELENAKKTFLIDGVAPREGQIFRNTNLACTYEAIANGGRAEFYKGALARKMDNYLKSIRAPLGYEDLASHTGNWIDPVSINYRGYDIFELPPNGQGAAALQMLKIIEGFDVRAMGAGSADALHLMIEAKRLAYEDLAKFYADPDFADIPMKELLSDEYAAERRTLIDMKSASRDVGPGEPKLIDGDTTYLAVADSDGMMVSLIQSNFRGMGSGLVPRDLGFMFQNRGELFSLEAGTANLYAPGKRPFHTIIPGFVMKDGAPWMAFGVMGGDMQPQGHMQVLSNMIDFDMNVQEAGDFMRFRHYGGSEPTGERAVGTGTVEIESGASGDVLAELARRGHSFAPGSRAFGGHQAVLYDHENGTYWGASEMRKDGEAIGY
jgi:gamma-glutamyltranspeptidase/glutathione hydrolase